MVKGYINSIETLGLLDGPGIRTIVFLSGCYLKCKYCHNPEMWKMTGKEYTAEELVNNIIKYKNYYGKEGGITFSGGEPLLQIDFLIEVCTLLNRENISIDIDTAGVGVGKYKEVLKYIDVVLLDIKHTDKKEYKDLTGIEMNEFIKFIKVLNKSKCDVWIRQVIIPGYTDSKIYLDSLNNFLYQINSIKKIQFLPFHQHGKEKYKTLNMLYPYENVEEMDVYECKKLNEEFIKRYNKERGIYNMKNVKEILDKMHVSTLTQGEFGAFDGETVRYFKPNYGFIPFFIADLDSNTLINSEKDGEKIYLAANNNMYAPKILIKDGILSKESPNRPGYKKVGGLGYNENHFIVIHDTGDIVYDAEGWNEIINTDSRGISWHFTIDDKDVYQHIPLNEVAWHAGDGSRTPLDRYFNKGYNMDNRLGGGNRNGIGIETCITKETDYNIVMRNTAKLVAKMLIAFGLTIDNVKQHYDFSGKNCPQSMRRLDLYSYFLHLVEIELILANEYKEYEFKYKSLSTNILDDTGKILKAYKGEISYQVTVKYKNEEISYIYKTIIQ